MKIPSPRSNPDPVKEWCDFLRSHGWRPHRRKSGIESITHWTSPQGGIYKGAYNSYLMAKAIADRETAGTPTPVISKPILFRVINLNHPDHGMLLTFVQKTGDGMIVLLAGQTWHRHKSSFDPSEVERFHGPMASDEEI